MSNDILKLTDSFMQEFFAEINQLPSDTLAEVLDDPEVFTSMLTQKVESKSKEKFGFKYLERDDIVSMICRQPNHVGLGGLLYFNYRMLSPMGIAQAYVIVLNKACNDMPELVQKFMLYHEVSHAYFEHLKTPVFSSVNNGIMAQITRALFEAQATQKAITQMNLSKQEFKEFLKQMTEWTNETVASLHEKDQKKGIKNMFKPVKSYQFSKFVNESIRKLFPKLKDTTFVYEEEFFNTPTFEFKLL